MKIRNFLLAGTVLVAVVVQSCKKDEVKNVNDALLSGNWHIHTATISGPSIPTTDAIGIAIDSCEADDIFNFEANNVLIKDAGAVKCSANDPQLDTTSWSLSADESLLTMGTQALTVVSHTNNSIELSVSLVTVNGTLTINLRND